MEQQTEQASQQPPLRRAVEEPVGQPQSAESIQTPPSPPLVQPAADASTAAEGATPAEGARPDRSARFSTVLAPLRQRTFRALCDCRARFQHRHLDAERRRRLADDVALTPSPLVVALMQTATSLPIFLIGLPAGALADLVNRRRLLLVAQAWMLLAAGLLGVLTLAGWTTPWVLLMLTFALGLGSALNAPAWQAVVPETVPASSLPAAIPLNSASFNLARAVGPALGGLVVAVVGPALNFLLNAASFLGTILVLLRWRRPPRTSHLPGERLLGATRAGLRYARHAPELHAVLVRCAAFITCASALWALLPLVARDQLGLSSFGYGALLGALGLGAVSGAGVLPRVRTRFSVDQQVAGREPGFRGWDARARTGAQCRRGVCRSTRRWRGLDDRDRRFECDRANVRAEMGAGACAGHLPARLPGRASHRQHPLGCRGRTHRGGDNPSRGGWLHADRGGRDARLALETGAHLDLSPSHHLPEPSMSEDIAPDPEEGPVLVTIEYRVRPGEAEGFVPAMRNVGRLRRRDGALRWDCSAIRRTRIGTWRPSSSSRGPSTCASGSGPPSPTAPSRNVRSAFWRVAHRRRGADGLAPGRRARLARASRSRTASNTCGQPVQFSPVDEPSASNGYTRRHPCKRNITRARHDRVRADLQAGCKTMATQWSTSGGTAPAALRSGQHVFARVRRSSVKWPVTSTMCCCRGISGLRSIWCLREWMYSKP